MILLRGKAKISVLILSLFSVFLISGCGDSGPDTTGKVIDNAVRKLEQFSKSHQVAWYGEKEVDLSKADIGEVKGVSVSKGKSAQKELAQISKEQLDDFNKAVEQLKSFASKTPGKASEGKTSALAKGLYAEMLVYKAGWGIDKLRLADSASLGQRSKIRRLCLQIEGLKSNQSALSPRRYREAVQKSQASIKLMEKLRTLTGGQLSQIKGAKSTLNSELQTAIKKRNGLNETIGNVTRQMDNASAEQALQLQKKTGKLEDKRFDVLVRIQKLRTGPIDLKKSIDIGVPGRSEVLKHIGGIQQLDQEQKRLEMRLKKINEAVRSQKIYLKNLNEQIRINSIKSKQLAKRLDELTATLKSQIEDFDTVLVSRNKISDDVKKNVDGAEKFAKQAESVLKQYFSALKEASALVKPGTTDMFLKEAKEADSLEFSLHNIIVNANLIRAKLISENLKSAKWTNEILTKAGELADLSEALAGALKKSADNQKKLSDELVEVIDEILKTCSSAAKRAKGDFKVLIKTQQASVLYQAAVLIPSRHAEFISKAKDIINEVLPAQSEKADMSRILLPARDLKRKLEM